MIPAIWQIGKFHARQFHTLLQNVDRSVIYISLQTTVTETTAPELAKLLYWLMVVGYSIRNIEVRFDMERVLGTTPKLAELPPGEAI